MKRERDTPPRLTDDELKLSTREAAAFLGLAVRTLEGLRLRGGGPRFFALSRRRVVYSKRALREWLAERERSSTSDDLGAPR